MEQASGQQMQDINKRLRLLSIPQASKSEQCDMPMDHGSDLHRSIIAPLEPGEHQVGSTSRVALKTHVVNEFWAS